MLRLHIQRHLRQEHIRADASGRANAKPLINRVHKQLRDLARRFSVQLQVWRQIQKALVYRIHMNIISAEIIKIMAIDGAGVFHVLLHARLRYNIFNPRRNLKQPAPVAHAKSLQRRRYRKADCTTTTRRVSHHKIGLKGVKPPLHALHRSIKAFQIYAGIIFFCCLALCFHNECLRQAKTNMRCVFISLL